MCIYNCVPFLLLNIDIIFYSIYFIFNSYFIFGRSSIIHCIGWPLHFKGRRWQGIICALGGTFTMIEAEFLQYMCHFLHNLIVNSYFIFGRSSTSGWPLHFKACRRWQGIICALCGSFTMIEPEMNESCKKGGTYGHAFSLRDSPTYDLSQLLE